VLIKKKVSKIKRTWKKNVFLNRRKNKSEISTDANEQRHATNKMISSKLFGSFFISISYEMTLGKYRTAWSPHYKTVEINRREDAEPATIALMDEFAAQNGYELDFSKARLHHEIYLSDPRKVAPEKLKTVTRHPLYALEASSSFIFNSCSI